MDKQEIIDILNANISKFDIQDVIKIITNYLLEHNKDTNKIQAFITLLCNNPIYMMEGSLEKCLYHSIDYYIKKFDIYSISLNNKVIYYFNNDNNHK